MPGGWVEDHPTIPLAAGVEAIVAYARRLEAYWLETARAEAETLAEPATAAPET